MLFKKLSPEKGYRNEFLWLPKKKLTPGGMQIIKNSLTFFTEGKAPVTAWSETADHIMVPREFIPFHRWAELDYEMEDVSQATFLQVPGVVPTFPLNGPTQHLAFEAMVNGGSGRLILSPGKGKTVVALHAWAATQMAGLVVVHTEDLLNQWIERIVQHTNVRLSDIGRFQGATANWEKPITVAMIHTLAARAIAHELPDGFEKHFGVWIFDEMHHLGAPFFNNCAGLSRGIRWGLSATDSRRDGLEPLYQHHIGPVLYQNLETDIVPECFFWRTGVELPDDEIPALRDRTGDINLAKLMTWLSKHEGRNALILHAVNEALAEGRKILGLSDRVDQLKFLHGMYPEEDAGLLIGSVSGEKRVDALQNGNPVFATTQLAKEGLDRKELDTLMLLLPVTDPDMFRQILGRIQRTCEGKLKPIFVVFEDERIKATASMCRKLRNHLVALQYPFHIVN